MSDSVAVAYDAIADHYDADVEGDRWMRNILWSAYARRFHPGDHVLDVSCGTGIDALFLAHLGVQVTAIDASAGMIQQLQAKRELEEHALEIISLVLDARDLATLPPQAFDGVISAFAGLNTLPNLDGFAHDIWSLVRPGGYCVFHVLNGFSLWEFAGLLKAGHWTQAKQLRHMEYRTFTIGGQAIQHRLYEPDEAASCFRCAGFEVESLYGLGVLRPPHNLGSIAQRATGVLGRSERVVRDHHPWLRWGRFFVVELRRPDVSG